MDDPAFLSSPSTSSDFHCKEAVAVKSLHVVSDLHFIVISGWPPRPLHRLAASSFWAPSIPRERSMRTCGTSFNRLGGLVGGLPQVDTRH